MGILVQIHAKIGVHFLYIRHFLRNFRIAFPHPQLMVRNLMNYAVIQIEIFINNSGNHNAKKHNFIIFSSVIEVSSLPL